MRKNILFFIAIVLLCGVVWGFILYNKPHRDVGDKIPDIIINADSLYQTYSTNEAEANKKFLNKIIEVSGTVADINKTDSTYIILLKAGKDMGGISCSIFTKNHLSSNKKQGETIIIKGKCTGFLMDVVLTDCVIEHQ